MTVQFLQGVVITLAVACVWMLALALYFWHKCRNHWHD